MKYFVTVNGAEHSVELAEVLGELRVAFDGEPLAVRYEEVDRLGQVALFVASPDGGNGGGEKAYAVSVEGDANEVQVTVSGHLYRVEIED